MKTCQQCQSSFELTEKDHAFFKRMDVLEPVMCPDCRFQNRIAFRNEQRFYKRICDLCKKPTISVYSQDKPITVYCSQCWWSDAYDPLEYGRDYDESRPFFEQLQELIQAVPKPAIMNMKSENCDYTNYSSENQNCYIAIGCTHSENCYYCYRILRCKDCVDCYDLQGSELCYECTQSRNLHHCTYCDSCENSSNLTLCSDCIGCRDCFGCVNLRNKQFYIFNQPYSEKDYHQKVTELRANWEEAKKEYKHLKISVPKKANHIVNCQNCSGNQMSNNKNCLQCFSLHNSEECHYTIRGDKNRFCYDTGFIDSCELMYNSISCHLNYDVIGANLVWYTKNSSYVTHCFNSNHLFGCVSMKKHQYCILNKQYSKGDYGTLAQKIIKEMKESGEWSQYYPISFSPFAYNETLAHEYFPLSKEQVLAKGWTWKDDVNEVPADLPGSAIKCEVSGKPFKLVPQEIAFYKKMGLPHPKIHPFERHQKRMVMSTQFKTYKCACQKCGLEVETSYSPEEVEKVYCEKCYLKEVY